VPADRRWLAPLVQRLLIPLRGILRHPLAREHRVRALARFVGWQVCCRLRAHIDVPFVNDARLRVARGMTGLTGNIYTGLHEFESMAFVLHYLRAGDLFADVGANAGTYTVLAAKAVGGSVVAIEPDDRAGAALRANVELNAIGDRVDVHAVIVGDRAGSLAFTCDQGAENHVAVDVDPSPMTRTIAVRTLDAILDGRVPCLIKLDVEGYELKVLQGAAATLASPRLRVLLVEINGYDLRYRHDVDELVGLLAAHGFSAHAYAPRQRALSPVIPARAEGNVIFVRDLDEAHRRLAAAPAFDLPGWNLSI
jgi:FkbM family methyltransferase